MNFLERKILRFFESESMQYFNKRQKKTSNGLPWSSSLLAFFPISFSFSLFFFLFFLPLFLSSCSHTNYLGNQAHNFAQNPKRIVWLQVAGLSEEHLSLLKFSYGDAFRKVSFENFSCMGKLWAFNLYKLRPKSSSSMLSQLTASSNIQTSCEDYKIPPVWKSLQERGFKVGVLESPLKASDSLLSSLKCKDSLVLKDVSFFSMNKVEKFLKKGRGLNFFHFQENLNINFDTENIYYDRACQKGACFSEFGDDLSYIYRLLKQEKSTFLLLGRQFQYEDSLLKNKGESVYKLLSEIDRITNFFIDESKSDPELLFLVSFAAPYSIDLPSQGSKAWTPSQLERVKFSASRETNLLSSVFAVGPGAEYFCGMYSESDLFSKRIRGF